MWAPLAIAMAYLLVERASRIVSHAHNAWEQPHSSFAPLGVIHGKFGPFKIRTFGLVPKVVAVLPYRHPGCGAGEGHLGDSGGSFV